MPSVLAYLVAALLSAGQTGEVHGRVTGVDGEPVADARVFAEPGLDGALVEAEVDRTGRFRLPEVPSGPVGVFAWAPDRALAGRHLNLAAGGVSPELTIRMGPPVTLSGRVEDPRGRPVANARVTRVALLGEETVAIPLTKLRAFGFDEPVSGEDGRFAVPLLPGDAQVALKVAHPRFAQEGVAGLDAGSGNVRVTLHPGVLLEGVVVARGEGAAVSNATVTIRNAQPPHDSVVTTSDMQGRFTVRLKPGVYMSRAAGAAYQSVGWTRLEVTGETALRTVRLGVARAGRLEGTVKDAVSGEPVEGVRVLLETAGNLAGMVRTGPDGTFAFTTAAGQNKVTVHPAPGYLPPPRTAWQVNVEEGGTLELPGIWLAPLPRFALTIVDSGGDPVPGAVVSLLRPYQFAWQVADDQGRLALNVGSFPAEGLIVAAAEHPTRTEGAVFALRPERTEGALVELYPFARAEGRVVARRGAGLPGVLVAGVMPGETPAEEVVLWRCVTGNDGHYAWDWVVPGVPQRAIARNRAGEMEQSRIFNAAPESAEQLDPIVLPGDGPEPRRPAGRLAWWTLAHRCGPEVNEDAPGPALVVFAERGEEAMVIAGLANAETVLRRYGVRPVAVVRARADCEEAGVSVYEGQPPGAGTTYVVDAEGQVVLETAGLPPLRALRGL